MVEASRIELLVDATFNRSVRFGVAMVEAGAASSSAVVYGSVASVTSVASVSVTSRAVKPLIRRSWEPPGRYRVSHGKVCKVIQL